MGVAKIFFKNMRSSITLIIHLISCLSCYRSSFMSNATDSEVNSMSSEEVHVLQEDDPLPPRPGT